MPSNNDCALVVTSIAAPNAVLKDLAAGSKEHGWKFYVIGDVPSPADFAIDGCDFYSLTRQRQTPYQFAASCPERHYSRKNIGYLLAIAAGAGVIVETDDDNFPRAEFWNVRSRRVNVPLLEAAGWVNAYSYFTEARIWPRGLPLDAILDAPAKPYDSIAVANADCPIQQGLADDNPDVDAIYRLILPLPIQFETGRRLALAAGSWCPFNSQNTSWWPEAYPLLYLPSYCSFRMTDIWRSFVAQRIAWENGWSLLFHEATVYQERNVHNLMRDFKDEVPGYLHNRAICEKLAELPIRGGVEHLGANLLACYEALVKMQWVGAQELALVEAWLSDLQQIQRTA